MSEPERSIVISKSRLTAVIGYAWTWGEWLRERADDARALEDPEAAARLDAIADRIAIDVAVVADSFGLALPARESPQVPTSPPQVPYKSPQESEHR